MIKFYQWEVETPREWHNVFLRTPLCQPLTSDYWPEAAQAVGRHSEQLFDALGKVYMMPGEEFVKTCADLGIEFVVGQIWGDGVSLFLLNENDAPTIKLIFELDEDCI